jgi:hypothetical protein
MRRLAFRRLGHCLGVVGLLGLTACRVPVDPGERSNSSANGSLSGTFDPAARFTSPRTSSRRFAQEEGEDVSPVLPVFMIDLQGRPLTGDDETPGVLTVIEEHDGSLTNLSKSRVALRSGMSLELHGSTSATLAKKSYRLELVDDRGQDRDLPLVGLPSGSDWVLHSCGFDPICLRNAMVYALARDMGHYAPRTRFIELFVDGGYQGLYVLIERIRRDEARVDLPRPSESADGDITGGYIFKSDLAEGKPGDRVPRDWVSPVSRTVYSYFYPRHDRITAAQKTYLHDHMARFETMMRGRNWSDSRSGYRQWLDMPSWIDFALIQELSMNPDAYFKSVYLQKWPRAMGDKLAIGPLWDFDLSFGVAEFRDARNTGSWAHTMNRFGTLPVPYEPPGEVPYVPEYWERLWADPAFHQGLQCRWQELRNGPLHLDALNARIDRWLEQLAVAMPRDAARWPDLPKNAYTGGEESLKAFLTARVAWIDANLPGRCVA